MERGAKVVNMFNNIYVVYATRSSYIDDYTDAYEVEDRWFTNEANAEACADYLDIICPDADHIVEEIACGDDIDYKSLLEEAERKRREKLARKAKESRISNMEQYACLKCRIEGRDGDDYKEVLDELMEKHRDYIEGKYYIY